MFEDILENNKWTCGYCNEYIHDKQECPFCPEKTMKSNHKCHVFKNPQSAGVYDRQALENVPLGGEK
jgi:hypothetical protein